MTKKEKETPPIDLEIKVDEQWEKEKAEALAREAEMIALAAQGKKKR